MRACVHGRPSVHAGRDPGGRPARPGDRAGAWLRVWTEVYVLAHLVNRPRPRVPVPLRQSWAGLDERLRECLLATCHRPRGTRPGAGAAGVFRPGRPRPLLAPARRPSMLDGGKGAGTMPGTTWVIPQLQWLHELERVCPLDAAAPDPFALAPPLDYALPEPGRPGRCQDRPAGQRAAPASAVDGGNPQPAARLDGSARRRRPGGLHRGPCRRRDRRQPPRPVAQGGRRDGRHRLA